VRGPPGARLGSALLALALVAGACGSGEAGTTPSPLGRAHLLAEVSGTVECAVFPNSCVATLSVLPAGTAVSTEWRPPASDPYWGPEWDGERPVHLSSHLNGSLTDLPVGNYEIVISILGLTDIPSYNPDGSVATFLLGRCSRDVSVIPATQTITVRVTFRQTQGMLAGVCEIEASIQPA
jgi:hypothetical protein